MLVFLVECVSFNKISNICTLFTPLSKGISKPFFSFYGWKCGRNGRKPVILKNKSNLEAAKTF